MKKTFLVVGLLLLLSACAMSEQAAYTPSPSVTPAPVHDLEEALAPEAAISYPDPITGFFRSLSVQHGCTPFTGMRLSWEAEAWQDELAYIYATLQQNASPALEGVWGVDLKKLEDSYLKFVSAQSNAEAYIRFTDAFGDEAGTYGERITRGTGFGGGDMQSQADLLEWQVKEWYSTFTVTFPNYEYTSALDYYQFDPQSTLDYLDEAGICYTVKEYTVEAQTLNQPDNPIDTWAAEQLYMSGTTVDMSNDAALEREIWEKELLYTYDRLIELASPYDEEPRKALMDARNALLLFAPDYGICVALYEYSEAFSPELWKDHPDGLYPGTLASPESIGVCGGCYRWTTLRLRELLSEVDRSEDPPSWLFNPADYVGRSAQEQRELMEETETFP